VVEFGYIFGDECKKHAGKIYILIYIIIDD
jgi:hypothetical protein